MSQQIWKFKIKVDDIIKITMPKGAEVLAIQMQRNEPCIWAMVQTDNPTEERVFEVIGTGYPMELLSITEERKYIGTFQMLDGKLVYHLFERNK